MGKGRRSQGSPSATGVASSRPLWGVGCPRWPCTSPSSLGPERPPAAPPLRAVWVQPLPSALETDPSPCLSPSPSGWGQQVTFQRSTFCKHTRAKVMNQDECGPWREPVKWQRLD